jgi:sirohydrochlorin cobaltochelatase
MEDKAMCKKCTIVLLTLSLIFFLTSACLAGAQGHSRADEKGTAVLLVTFGTSIPSAQAAFANIEKLVKKAFPETEIHWAYTSHIIRKKMAKEGKILNSPETALARLMEDGYSKVLVQSLHMIPGSEFHDIRVNAKMFENMSGGFKKVFVSYPLLAGNDNMDKAVERVISHMIPKERKADEAVVLMGHGTHHTADAVYSAMMYKFQKADPNIFMGTVEGHPSFDEVREMLLKKGIRRAYLLPFMSVAGDHAMNDMAGDEEDSWKIMLEKEGIKCIPVLKGIAEYDALAEIWIDNMKVAMSHLK